MRASLCKEELGRGEAEAREECPREEEVLHHSKEGNQSKRNLLHDKKAVEEGRESPKEAELQSEIEALALSKNRRTKTHREKSP